MNSSLKHINFIKIFNFNPISYHKGSIYFYCKFTYFFYLSKICSSKPIHSPEPKIDVTYVGL